MLIYHALHSYTGFHHLMVGHSGTNIELSISRHVYHTYFSLLTLRGNLVYMLLHKKYLIDFTVGSISYSTNTINSSQSTGLVCSMPLLHLLYTAHSSLIYTAQDPYTLNT